MKNVLITGAAGDIGSALVKVFACAGYGVIIHFNKNSAAAEKLKSEYGGICVQADISNPESVKAMFDSIGDKKIDTVINNAGVQAIKMFCDTSFEEIKEQIDVNLLGTCYVNKCAIEHMMWSGGSIINISSVWGQCGGACEAAYSAAKAGVIGLTKALAKEYGNIRVNCICPGAIEGKMNAHIKGEDLKTLIEEIPAGRLGRADEVARTALFLAENEYITGQIIAVNGGMYI